jgi:Zn-finger nucleic acid-binding protein
MTTKDWICKRCFHSTTTKSNLISHLRNKKECLVDTDEGGEDIAIQIYIDELLTPKKPKKYSCPHCDSRFSYNQSMNKHIKTCKNNVIINKDDKDKLIEELQAQIKQYKQQQAQSSNTVINNNNNGTIINNTFNITINKNNFGSEDTSYLTNDFIKYCIENPTRGITELIEIIHYNPEHPENHNIRCKSLKKNVFEKLVDSEWTLCDASNTLDELIKKGYRIMNTYYMDNIHNDTDIQDDEMQQARYQFFRFLGDKSSNQYFSVKRELRLLVKTKTDTLYILAMPEQHIPIEHI